MRVAAAAPLLFRPALQRYGFSHTGHKVMHCRLAACCFALPQRVHQLAACAHLRRENVQPLLVGLCADGLAVHVVNQRAIYVAEQNALRHRFHSEARFGVTSSNLVRTKTKFPLDRVPTKEACITPR